MSMPALFKGRLSIPVIGAPLFIISVPDLVIAQCKAGIVGSFPALNARPPALLDEWLARIKEELAAHDKANPDRLSAPFAVNQIVHRSNNRLDHDLALCEKHKVPMIITSLGAREELNQAAHGWGGIVFHDVINQKFAHKAVEKGADGLILVSAGAGGHAGEISPFAFVAETRQWFDGPIALSGAIGNGRAIRAVRILGADFAYIGSAFIATSEANAVEGYKQMITTSTAEDIVCIESVHRRAWQLSEAIDRRGRNGSGQSSRVGPVEDEFRHRRSRRARQAESLEGNLGQRPGRRQRRQDPARRRIDRTVQTRIRRSRRSAAVMDAIYRVEGNRVVTSPDAAGPWDAQMQHGSAPAALVVWAAEAIPTPEPMRIARVTIDLMRPVPVAPLTFETEVLREGRKIQLCAVKLRAGNVVVVTATVLKIKTQALTLPPDVADVAVTLPGPDQAREELPDFSGSPFVKGISMRAAHGRFGLPGPGAIWYRVDRPVVEGSSVSQAMRGVVAADFCNGTSAALDFRQWTFINADLTVSFARQPVGEWILLDAESWIGPDGAGLAAARLADSRGYFGRAVQSLVIEKR